MPGSFLHSVESPRKTRGRQLLVVFLDRPVLWPVFFEGDGKVKGELKDSFAAVIAAYGIMKRCSFLPEGEAEWLIWRRWSAAGIGNAIGSRVTERRYGYENLVRGSFKDGRAL